MARPSPYPPELRERAVRMVAEARPDYPAEWAAIKAVAAKLGTGAAETVSSTATHNPAALLSAGMSGTLSTSGPAIPPGGRGIFFGKVRSSGRCRKPVSGLPQELGKGGNIPP